MKTNSFSVKISSPIPHACVVKLDRESGEVMEQWGHNIFFVPHGLEVRKKGKEREGEEEGEREE